MILKTECFSLEMYGQLLRNLQQMQCDADNTCDKDALSENLKRIASDKGFVISDNEGSGNCMFHALSEQLHFVKGATISHEELRRYIVQYLRKNPKLVSLVICFVVVVQQMLTCGLMIILQP